MMMSEPCPRAHPLREWMLMEEPFYLARGAEVKCFEAAYRRRLPVLLKGPTGCGKTRFLEYMAWRLGKPLVMVSCHERLSADDLVGRWLPDAGGSRWLDGPLTLAARHGALCYLDDIVEAPADAAVALHPLSDSRRILPLEKRNEQLYAHGDFHLVASCNLGDPASATTMKAATRQRFTALIFDYPEPELEARILARETGVAVGLARQLANLGARTRGLLSVGLQEGASTRMLVHAASLTQAGLSPREACMQAVVEPLSDQREMLEALRATLDASFT